MKHSLILLLLILHTATAKAAPNILLAISDDQSFPHTSAYGYKAIQTPAFDRVAREGVLFTNAIAASPGCSPCRAALLTGRHTWQIEHAGTHASSFSSKYATYPDLLESAGYHVGYTGKGWGPGNFKAGGRTRNPAGNTYSKITAKPPFQGIRSTDYAANFKQFLSERKDGQPFCFWYGGSEPHRVFEKGCGLKSGKKLEDVVVPAFLPDTPEIRSDILDYCVEIEWFDKHLGRMLEMLDEADELDNTLVIVTSDNGMAFPRAKANCYEYGIHMPSAIRWGAAKPGRRVDDLVGFVDLTATILEAADVQHPSKQFPPSGQSITNILKSSKSGIVDGKRTAVFSARERHSSSRYNNLAYPQRSIRTDQYLLIHNFRPNRWPAGTPRKFEKEGKLGPMHGGYHDIDACPSLTFLIENRDDPKIKPYFHWSVDKRPEYELFDIRNDAACLNNLSGEVVTADIEKQLVNRLDNYLKSTGDPRAIDGGDIFETYKRYSRIHKFPKPE